LGGHGKPGRTSEGEAHQLQALVNSSWYTVEEGGAPQAGKWTEADNKRLRALVDHAHAMGYWVRFYALDGFAPAEDQGWGMSYNFGSREASVLRWKPQSLAGLTRKSSARCQIMYSLSMAHFHSRI
jgi:hypothetical protein